MNWQPIAGGVGGYMIGGTVGSVVDEIVASGPPVAILAGGVGGAYLGYKYVAAHPTFGVPMLLGGLLARVFFSLTHSRIYLAPPGRGWG